MRNWNDNTEGTSRTYGCEHRDYTGGSYPTYDYGHRDYTGTGRDNASWGSRDEGNRNDTDRTIYVQTNR